MVFVWGEGGQAAFEEAKQQEPPLCMLTLEAEAQGELMSITYSVILVRECM